MPIFDHEPGDWTELQNRVAQLFSELGCEVAIAQRVRLVRGEKEVDVSVRDPATTPDSVYLCECKFWRRPIPQEVVHSFRTVVADSGANRGFIISRVGFQSGATEAATNTNLNLLTFEELQALFFDRWRVAMGRRYRPYSDRLFPYWDIPGKMPSFRWEEEHRARWLLLIAAYGPVLRVGGPWFEMHGSVWDLPMTLPTLDEKGLHSGVTILSTYRQVYDFIDEQKDVAFKQFRALYGENDF